MKIYAWKDLNVFGEPNLLYAAGAIIASWNLCEFSMLSLLKCFIGSDGEITSKIYALLGNDSRQDLLLYAAENSEETTKEFVLAYTKHYSICLGNRNLIAHSVYLRNPLGKLEFLRKAPKFQTTLNAFDVDEESMLEIANSCYKTYLFGANLASYVETQEKIKTGEEVEKYLRESLPQIPPLPRALVPRRQEDQNNDSLLPLTFEQ